MALDTQDIYGSQTSVSIDIFPNVLMTARAIEGRLTNLSMAAITVDGWLSVHLSQNILRYTISVDGLLSPSTVIALDYRSTIATSFVP